MQLTLLKQNKLFLEKEEKHSNWQKLSLECFFISKI